MSEFQYGNLHGNDHQEEKSLGELLRRTNPNIYAPVPDIWSYSSESVGSFLGVSLTPDANTYRPVDQEDEQYEDPAPVTTLPALPPPATPGLVSFTIPYRTAHHVAIPSAAAAPKKKVPDKNTVQRKSLIKESVAIMDKSDGKPAVSGSTRRKTKVVAVEEKKAPVGRKRRLAEPASASKVEELAKSAFSD